MLDKIEQGEMPPFDAREEAGLHAALRLGR